MGLRQLTRFVNQRYLEESVTDFPLAVASINVTGILQSYLHLNPSVHPMGGASGAPTKCSERTFSAFLELCLREGAPRHCATGCSELLEVAQGYMRGSSCRADPNLCI